MFMLAPLVACFAGCHLAPSQDRARAEAQAIGYGPAPTNHEAYIKGFIGATLKDPDSALYQFETPYQGFTYKNPLRGGGLGYAGWIVAVSVNAKNSYGAYTGYERKKFLFRDGHLLAVSGDNGDWIELKR